MVDIIRQAPSWATHLSDRDENKNPWMTEIPTGYVFNKGITGCGATTLAIKQPGNTILAMPYRGLVENKAASNKELLGIHGEMERESEIIKYIQSHDQLKIATTYDSLPVVCDTLIAQGQDPYKNCFLFVDEWHTLLNSYKYRYKAVRAVLDRAPRFDRKTFVSATPLPREYWLTELAGMPEYRLEWPNATKVNVISQQVDDPVKTMARLCKSRVSNGGDDHYHIFINSVEGISRIIRLAGLTPDQVRIVCSQSQDSKDKNQEKLGDFQIQTTLDPVRVFNFYTSTCFEGQDIFDKVGRTFIVSDRYLDHTKIDIMTTLAQVCGRLRDSEFKNEIHQYYATSPYKDVSLEEFKAATECQFNEAKVFAAAMDSAAKGTLRDRLIEDFVKKYMFLAEQNGKIVADRNLVNKELMNFGIVNGQYASQFNMNASLSQAGFQVNTNNHTHLEDVELETITSIEKSSFKDIFEEYAGIRSSKGMFNMRIFRASRIELEKPLVKEAFEILGADRVREMKYHQSNIKKEIIKRKHETADTKIFLLLDGQLPKQVAIPKSEIKQKLTDIYKELGLEQTAKATDLERWYNIKNTTKRLDDGSTQSCFCIISSKLKVPSS